MPSKRIAIAVLVGAVLAVSGVVVAFAASNQSASSDGWRMMGGRYSYQPAKPAPVRTLAGARADAQKFADRLGLRVDEVLRFADNYYAKLVDSQGNGATEVLVDPATGLVSIEYGPAMMWNTRYGMGRGAAGMMGSYGESMMRDYGGAMMGASGPSSASLTTTATSTSPGYGSGMMSGTGSGDGMMGGSGSGGSGATATSTTSTSATVSLAAAHSLAQRWLDAHEAGVNVETGGDAFPGYYTLETLKAGQITGMISVNAATGAVWPHWWHGAFIAKSA
jgi:hypothetical protein